jgi:LysR family transcriptional regulator, hypochlorite-specific transcription factor HypT
MAEALKAMAIEGHGIAWLPDSAVNGGNRTRSLALAGDETWCGEIEIRLYRDGTQVKPLLDGLWDYLQRQVHAQNA